MNKEDANRICHTFDSFFCEWSNGSYYPESLKDKTLLSEEFSIVPNKWMTKIYNAFTDFNNKVYMFSDPNQCEPVEAGSPINHNYLESEAKCGTVAIYKPLITLRVHADMTNIHMKCWINS